MAMNSDGDYTVIIHVKRWDKTCDLFHNLKWIDGSVDTDSMIKIRAKIFKYYEALERAFKITFALNRESGPKGCHDFLIYKIRLIEKYTMSDEILQEFQKLYQRTQTISKKRYSLVEKSISPRKFLRKAKPKPHNKFSNPNKKIIGSIATNATKKVKPKTPMRDFYLFSGRDHGDPHLSGSDLHLNSLASFAGKKSSQPISPLHRKDTVAQMRKELRDQNLLDSITSKGSEKVDDFDEIDIDVDRWELSNFEGGPEENTIVKEKSGNNKRRS